MKEKLLFAALGGSYKGQQAAIIMQDHCLPIACSHGSWAGQDGDRPHAEAGIYALWEATGDAEEFFEHLGIEGIHDPSPATKPNGWRPEGLYVYEVEYDEGVVDQDADDDWSHLEGGHLRRPTLEELAPLTEGFAPWGGVVL
jgi:hypothetical protein